MLYCLWSADGNYNEEFKRKKDAIKYGKSLSKLNIKYVIDIWDDVNDDYIDTIFDNRKG